MIVAISKTILLFFGCTGSVLLLSGFSLVTASGGYSLIVVHGLLIAVASLVAGALALGPVGFRSCGSQALEHKVSSCGTQA